MVRTKEGGSVLGFIAIGVVLIALFLGGVYFMHQQTRPSETPQPAPEQPITELPGQTPTPEPGVSQPTQQPQANNPPSSQPNLPQTGPRESLSSILIAGMLVGATVYYVRSRRLRASL